MGRLGRSLEYVIGNTENKKHENMKREGTLEEEER